MKKYTINIFLNVSSFISITLTLILVNTGSLIAQNSNGINVVLTDLAQESLREKMSRNASDFLTELSNAFAEQRLPNLSHVDMSRESQENMMRIWMFAPCCSTESEIITRCLQTTDGYQIRGIPVRESGRDNIRDIVVNFSEKGVINDIYFALDNYHSIVKKNNSILDLRRRQTIMMAIEKLRTAYVCRDIRLAELFYFKDNKNLNLVYDANKQRYDVTSAEMYMSELTRGFYTLDWDVDIEFKDILVVQHPEDNNVYGVTIRQAWQASNQTEDCWLAFILEFVSDIKMLVLMASWQPYMIDGKIIPRSEVLQLGEFEI